MMPTGSAARKSNALPPPHVVDGAGPPPAGVGLGQVGAPRLPRASADAASVAAAAGADRQVETPARLSVPSIGRVLGKSAYVPLHDPRRAVADGGGGAEHPAGDPVSKDECCAGES